MKTSEKQSAVSETTSTRFKFHRLGVYLPLIFFALVFVIPLAVMTMTSVRTLEDIRENSVLAFPSTFTFDAWKAAWSSACIATRCEGLSGYFMNSAIIVVPSVVISTAVGLLNGFALTKVRFRFDNLLFGLLLIGCFIPHQILLIPIAQTLGYTRLSNTPVGLISIYVIYGIPFTTMFARNFFVHLPDDLIKAARVDGAEFWTMFRRVILPLSPPVIVVTMIWQFTQIWNDFLFAATFTRGDGQTMMVALNNLVNTTFGEKAYNVEMAGAMIAAAPTLIVYLLAGKFFIRGLTAGAVKG